MKRNMKRDIRAIIRKAARTDEERAWVRERHRRYREAVAIIEAAKKEVPPRPMTESEKARQEFWDREARRIVERTLHRD